MKLMYLNQKPGQAIPIVKKAPSCVMRFAVPGDTAVPGGGTITLRAQADCASTLFRSVRSGPTIPIFDPGQPEVTLLMPKVDDDTEAVIRFTAEFADSTRYGDIRIRITTEESAPLLLRAGGRFGPGASLRDPSRPERGARDALGRTAIGGWRWRALRL